MSCFPAAAKVMIFFAGMHDDAREILYVFAVAMSRCEAVSLSASLAPDCRGRNGEIAEFENGGG